MTAAETGFALAIVLASATGLLLTSRILEGWGKRRRQMFVYYTNLSNAAMLIAHILLFMPGRTGTVFRSARVRYFTVLCILVTFVIYFFVLTRFGRHNSPGSMESLGVLRVSNAVVHYIVPGLTLLEWITVADRSGLGLREAAEWLIIPLSYFAFLILRARIGTVIRNTQSLWPYAFLDREMLGTAMWLRNAALTLMGFFLLALLMLGAAAWSK